MTDRRWLPKPWPGRTKILILASTGFLLLGISSLLQEKLYITLGFYEDLKILAVAVGLSAATLALRSFALLFLTILVWVNGTMTCIDTCFVRWSVTDVHPATVAYWNRWDEYSDIVRIAGIVACSMAMMVALSPRSLRQIYNDKVWLRRALQARPMRDR